MVSVIIVNYNGERFLRECVESVLNTDYPSFEVVVVDNASTDQSLDIMKGAFGSAAKLKIVQNKENVGHAQGCNIGASRALGEYVVFLDSDTTVDRNWLRELLRFVAPDESIGSAQSRMLSMTDPNILDSGGRLLDFLGHAVALDDQTGQVKEVFYATSGAMLLRKSVFTEASGMDPDMFIYAEIDLGWRIRLSGYRIVYVPSSIVYHLRRGTTSQRAASWRTFHGVKNNLATLIKNYEKENLFKYLPLCTVQYVAYFFYAIRKGYALDVIGIMKAFSWILKEVKRLYEKRQKVQKRRLISDEQIAMLMVPTLARSKLLRRIYSHA